MVAGGGQQLGSWELAPGYKPMMAVVIGGEIFNRHGCRLFPAMFTMSINSVSWAAEIRYHSRCGGMPEHAATLWYAVVSFAVDKYSFKFEFERDKTHTSNGGPLGPELTADGRIGVMFAVIANDPVLSPSERRG